ncbi:GNAT family N-acetyltransferase [Nocardia farcinica]|uniref:GNAT family N-acetyltransferase n=1 Tax=Nocardia farcinica TaxID=37329 RepID=UPI00245490EF|nr:GNAT family N-acetyltransferase [Nocardia farcinica]
MSSSTALAFRDSHLWFAELLGGRWVGDVHVLDTGLPDATFNGVGATRRATPELVAETVRGFTMPFHWRVGPTCPAELDELLPAAGLVFEEEEPIMWLDLETRPAAPDSALDIRHVTDLDGLRAWVRVWGADSTPRAVMDTWFAAYAGLYRRLSMRIGLLDGEPVACCYSFLHGGVAAIEYVVVRPDHRRKGFGETMTRAALADAASAGATGAVLTASPEGIGIYRRLGFRPCGTQRTYLAEPVREGDGDDRRAEQRRREDERMGQWRGEEQCQAGDEARSSGRAPHRDRFARQADHRRHQERQQHQ